MLPAASSSILAQCCACRVLGTLGWHWTHEINIKRLTVNTTAVWASCRKRRSQGSFWKMPDISVKAWRNPWALWSRIVLPPSLLPLGKKRMFSEARRLRPYFQLDPCDHEELSAWHEGATEVLSTSIKGTSQESRGSPISVPQGCGSKMLLRTFPPWRMSLQACQDRGPSLCSAWWQLTWGMYTACCSYRMP